MKGFRGMFVGLAVVVVGGAAWAPVSAAAGDSCVEVYGSITPPLHTLIDVETGSARSFVDPTPQTTGVPSDPPTAYPTPEWLTLTPPPLAQLFLDPSPDGSYLAAYYTYSDFAALFNVYTADGTLVWTTSVGTVDMGVEPRYAWIDDHRLMISEATDMLIDNAVLIDLAAGESRLVHEGVRTWVLSPDGRLLAVQPYQTLDDGESRQLDLYDLTAPDAPPVVVPLTEHTADLLDMVWSADSRDLLALGSDETVSAYNAESAAWRTLTAAHLGYRIRRSPCHVLALDAQRCAQFGGFATSPALWYFRLADGSRIPVQMLLEPGEDARFSIVRLREDAAVNQFALALADSQSGRTIVVDEPVSGAVEPTLSVSPDGSLIAVAYGYPTYPIAASVKLFKTSELRLYATFEVSGEETEVVWAPDGRYLAVTSPGDGLDSLTLYEVGVGKTTIQTGYRTYRRLSWSPDDTYLVDTGTHGDFSAEMSVFATDGGAPLVENLIVSSVDDAGNTAYGWLDNHTLIVQLDPNSEALSSIDLRVTPVQPQPLDGATMGLLPCDSSS